MGAAAALALVFFPCLGGASLLRRNAVSTLSAARFADEKDELRGRGPRVLQSDPCSYANDGECDVPTYCSSGDYADCAGHSGQSGTSYSPGSTHCGACAYEAHATLTSCDASVCNYICNEGYHNFGTVWGGHCTTCGGGEHFQQTVLGGSCTCEDGYYQNYRPDSQLTCANHNNEVCCLPCSRFAHQHEVGTGSDCRCVCDEAFPHLTPAGCVACSSVPHAVDSADGQSCVCEPGYFWTDAHKTECGLQATCPGHTQMQTTCPFADDDGLCDADRLVVQELLAPGFNGLPSTTCSSFFSEHRHARGEDPPCSSPSECAALCVTLASECAGCPTTLGAVNNGVCDEGTRCSWGTDAEDCGGCPPGANRTHAGGCLCAAGAATARATEGCLGTACKRSAGCQPPPPPPPPPPAPPPSSRRRSYSSSSTGGSNPIQGHSSSSSSSGGGGYRWSSVDLLWIFLIGLCSVGLCSRNQRVRQQNSMVMAGGAVVRPPWHSPRRQNLDHLMVQTQTNPAHGGIVQTFPPGAVWVKCPAGLSGGQSFTMNMHDGRTIQIQVPPGVTAGQR